MSLSPKLLVLTGLVVASMVFLMARTIGGQSGVYYLELQEYLSKPIDRTVRLAGFVAAGTIEKDASGLSVKFVLKDQQNGALSLPVVFDARSSGGRIPDTFTDGSQVVVSGKMNATGAFQASQMLAKCPSKYEAADPAGHPAPQS
jgi:cytochrome c-type biogenesis protein CcmE